MNASYAHVLQYNLPGEVKQDTVSLQTSLVMSTWNCDCCDLINSNKRWICQACFTENTHLKNKRNLKELLAFGYTRKYNDHIPIEIILICKQYFGPSINSKILKINEKLLLLNYLQDQIGIENVYNWSWNLIFRATEHGFKSKEFYKHCDNKRNTVVIVYNKTDDQVFGGYTPCILRKLNDWTRGKWEKTRYVGSPVVREKDDTLTTCLFILRTKLECGTQLFKLKKDKCDRAINYYSIANNVAFSFGNSDFAWLATANLISTQAHLMQTDDVHLGGSCFEYNDTQKDASIRPKDSYLCGKEDMITPNEIEVFQLK